jgi:hypothetical protein
MRNSLFTFSSDESLKKWKASLGITDEIIPSDPNDPRRVNLIHRVLTLVPRWLFSNWLWRWLVDKTLFSMYYCLGFFRSYSDRVKMSSEGTIEQLKQKPFIIKEGTEYRYAY